MDEPRAAEEWQEAVNQAAFLELLHSAKCYGLITGGPKVNVSRCDDILRRGARRGIRPASTDVLISRYLRAVIEPVLAGDHSSRSVRRLAAQSGRRPISAH